MFPLTFYDRDALLTTYPTIKHLMCYFHVIKNCKDHVKCRPKSVQESIMKDIYYLHQSYSQEEFQVRLEETNSKWEIEEPSFSEYFLRQWNTEDSFNTWKIFCSAPGVATTNNALESFNNTIKKIYTFGARHTLPALFDIIIQKLLFNYSVDVVTQRKVFEDRRRPCSSVRQSSCDIDDKTYKVTTHELLYTFTKLENNRQHVVDFSQGSCTCRFFLKHAYCKHILHIHKLRNEDSDTIIIDRHFKYKGNTKMTQRQRGRVRDAAPALERN